MNGEERGGQKGRKPRQAETVAAQPGEKVADGGVKEDVDHVITPRIQSAQRVIPPENKNQTNQTHRVAMAAQNKR